MKRRGITAILLSVSLCTGLSACGGSSAAVTTKAAAATAAKTQATATTAKASATTEKAATTAKTASTTEKAAVSGGNQNKTTIQFWHSMSGANGDMLNKIIEKYNSSQNKVEVVGTYQGDYWTSGANAITAIATGNGPDLIQLGWGQVRLLSDNEGVAANMLDYMKKEDGVWLEDFREGFVSCFLNKEKKYLPCLPMGCSTPVMYCKRLGLKMPVWKYETWDESRSMRKLVDGVYRIRVSRT